MTAGAEPDQVIIATAGHIDHGKTALVKALTGVDADTLAEEKRRGITIELGFVFMDVSGLGKQIVFIDVPGHERLIRTMVAGASNVDAALLVVAADEGVSAQTVEHLDILRLLDVGTGVVALTKTDLVDESRLQEATEEVRAFVGDSFLSEAPIVCVSSVTAAGVEDLRAALADVARLVPPRRDSGVFRMPIDRVFVMHGFGTVIAGTVLSGEVSVGDSVEIFPEGIVVAVRGIQVHGHKTQTSVTGRRTAINLQDVPKDRLRRGQCAGAPGSLVPTQRMAARLQLLRNVGVLKNRARVRLHVGTDEVIARVTLLDCDTLEEGGTAIVQFHLERPAVAVRDDRFVVRRFSPVATIGGGVIVDVSATRYKRFDRRSLDSIGRLSGGLSEAVEQRFLERGLTPQSPAAVAVLVGAGVEQALEVVDELEAQGELVAVGPGAGGRGGAEAEYVHATAYRDAAGRLTGALDKYFAENPYRLIMPLAALRAEMLRLLSPAFFDVLLADLTNRSVVYRKASGVGLCERTLPMSKTEQTAAQRIEDLFRRSGFATPLEEDARRELGLDPPLFQNLVTALLEQERLIRLDDKVVYHADSVKSAWRAVSEEISRRGSVAVGEVRDMLHVSRKYAIALLEYFDRIGRTKREGDGRVLA